MRWMQLFLLASLLCGGGSVVRARGTTPKRRVIGLAVLPGSGTTMDVARLLRRRMLRTFAREAKAVLVDPFRVLTDEPLRVPSAVQRSIQRGIEAVGQRKYHAAMALLQQAQDGLHAELAHVPKQALADVALHLAIAQLGARRRQQARQTLQDLLSWRSRGVLTPQVEAPAAWGQLLIDARRGLAEAPAGSIRLTTTPAGAEAFVDGRRVRQTPSTVDSLPFGPHYVTFKLDGYQRMMVRVDLRSKQEELSVSLESERPAIRVWLALNEVASQLGQDPLRFPTVLRHGLGLSVLLVAVVHRRSGAHRVGAFLYQLDSGKLVARTELTFRGPPRGDRLQALALWRGPVAPPKTRPPMEKGTPWYRRWWVWTGVAVVGAAAVALPLALLRSDEEAPSGERYRVSW